MKSAINKASAFISNNMFVIMLASAALMVFGLAAPFDAAYAAGDKLQGVLTGLGTVCGIIGAIAMLVMLVKAIFEFATGQGSVGKILLNFAIMLLFIALIATCTNISTIQDVFGGVTDTGLEVVSDAAETALGSGASAK